MPEPIPVFDGHNDVLLRLAEEAERPGGGRSFLERSDDGHLDLPRAREAGLKGGFFAIYTPSQNSPARVDGPGNHYRTPLAPAPSLEAAQRHTTALLARLFRLEREAEGALKVCRTVTEIRSAIGSNVLAVVLHVEGAEGVDPEMEALEVWYRAGLRSLGPVWSRANAFGCGVPFEYPGSPDTGPGLSERGRELVRACNSLGILIDLSHLNEAGFWDVARVSERPLVATHSNAHAICPVPRNLTDRQLDAIKETRGVVGLNFAVGFLDPGGSREADLPLEVLVRHIDHLIGRLGVEGVALGSDFDGCTVPRGIGDVTGLPRLLDELRAHGYDDSTLRRICLENWLDVLERTWE